LKIYGLTPPESSPSGEEEVTVLFRTGEFELYLKIIDSPHLILPIQGGQGYRVFRADDVGGYIVDFIGPRPATYPSGEDLDIFRFRLAFKP